jgi:glycosyltransferase involved in cell wall biosynthesis
MQEFSQRLAQLGHGVTVVTTTAYSTAAFRQPGIEMMAAGECVLGGVRVRRHRPDARLAPRLEAWQRRAFRFHVPGNGILRTIYDGPLAPGMLVDACREPADLIGATAFPLLQMHFAVAAGEARRVPTVLWGALHPEDRWGFDRRVIRSAIRHSDAYLAYTTFEQDYVAGLGLAPERIHVIPPGVDTAGIERGDGLRARDELGIPPGDPIVGFLGQIGGHKGIDVLVQSMRYVWPAVRDAWLVIAGATTDYLETVQAEVDKLSPSRRKRVRLVLDFPRDAKADLLAAFDVFASPSGYESFGLTFVEAWAAGLPVIGCRSGAIPSVVENGADGLLVTYGSVHELAGALIELLVDEAYRDRIATAGRAKSRTVYTWERSAARLDDLYRSLAGTYA